MSITNIIIIAIALAMDAFAVSIVVGMKLKKISGRQIFRLSWHFGLFQALMPVIGWGVGYSILPYIEKFDHWVAFVLIFCVGANMIREAVRADSGDNKHTSDPTKGTSLVLLSVATSIDALAVGFSISMLNAPVAFPALVIGLVAGAGTIAGMYIGRSIGVIPRVSTFAEIVGGFVLWCIGINILIEHGVFKAM